MVKRSKKEADYGRMPMMNFPELSRGAITMQAFSSQAICRSSANWTGFIYSFRIAINAPHIFCSVKFVFSQIK